jgi:plastocyanin
MRARILAFAALALAAPLAAALAPLAEPAGQAVSGPVTMNILTGFSPPVVVVNAGGSVTWINGDTVPHTATSVLGGPPHSGVIDPGKQYTATFAAAGAVLYHCELHPWMNGVVVVAP